MVQELASALDGWVSAGRAKVGETPANLAVRDLSVDDARALATHVERLAWSLTLEDRHGNLFKPADLADAYQPYRANVTKPAGPADVLRLVTLAGFEEWLEQPTPDVQVQIVGARDAWDTRGVRFGPWVEPAPFALEGELIQVRRVVRETANAPSLPEDLRPWVLKAKEAGDLDEPAFKLWAAASARHLVRALSNEVETPHLLLFRGPPVLRLELEADLMKHLGPAGFRGLQAAAIWVFDSSRDLDTRHGFFAAEVPRSAPARAIAGPVFARVAEPALEGAKIAFQLHLSQVSRDSLKAMSELRKGVADETGKLAESARGVAGAVSAAALGGVALIAARLTLAAPRWPVVFLALALAMHVAAVAYTGWRFLEVQRSLRSSWRSRLYAFLPEADFKALVTTPVSQAEGTFRWTAILGGIAAFLILAAAGLMPDRVVP